MINPHQIPEELRKAMYEKSKRLYELSEIQRKEFEKRRVKTEHHNHETRKL